MKKAIVAAVQKAQHRYEDMADGWWLQHAPEYFLTTTIAEHIFDEFAVHVYMDASMSRIWNNECDVPIDRTDISQMRPDISVWRTDLEDIYCCIEVKNDNTYERFENDLDRLRELVDGEYCEVGFAVVYASYAKSVDRYRERVKVLEEKFCISGEMIPIAPKKPDPEGFKAAVLLFEIKPS